MFDELLLKMKMHTWGSFCTDQKIPKKSANTSHGAWETAVRAYSKSKTGEVLGDHQEMTKDTERRVGRRRESRRQGWRAWCQQILARADHHLSRLSEPQDSSRTDHRPVAGLT